MIEADVVLGVLKDDPIQKVQPIMSHDVPVSDISLAQFLNVILEFNQLTTEPERKGVKLDFKSTEVFTTSLPILDEMMPKMNYPVWINADILPGPVDNVLTVPVDVFTFLQGCKRFPKTVISSGWTTRWGKNFTDGRYTIKQIFQMVEAIENNKLNETGQEITFPVRAGIAANSGAELKSLFRAINESNTVTFTIWSSKDDFVDADKLNSFICEFGVDKIYVDVPEDLEERLNLSCNNGNSFTTFGGCYMIALIAIPLILKKMLC